MMVSTMLITTTLYTNGRYEKIHSGGDHIVLWYCQKGGFWEKSICQFAHHDKRMDESSFKAENLPSSVWYWFCTAMCSYPSEQGDCIVTPRPSTLHPVTLQWAWLFTIEGVGSLSSCWVSRELLERQASCPRLKCHGPVHMYGFPGHGPMDTTWEPTCLWKSTA